MKLTEDALKLDLPMTTTRIKRFIADYVKKTRAKGIVIGVSGGIDSSTAVALAASAIGGNKISALNMPEDETYNAKDIEHAENLAEKFDFKLQTVDITSTLKAHYKSIPIYDKSDLISKGNIKARVRMTHMYYYANHLQKIVCGSSDKSETMMGYFTKWGDVAADISPLMDLYKTQVRQIASYIGVPEEIIRKAPTPQLWPGQLAEVELGIKYEMLDLILLGLENFLSPTEIAQELGISKKLVINIKKTWLSREHKRRLPLTFKSGFRTIGMDFRLPYTLAQ